MEVKKVLFVLVVFLISVLLIKINNNDSNKIISHSLEGMPIVKNPNPQIAQYYYGDPKEDRGPEYKKFLSKSVKISISGSMGSGTIVYFDKINNEAYVASCGHLWSGTRDVNSLKYSPLTCKLIVWYQNDMKLSKPKEYVANVLFYSNVPNYDCSLLKFRPDWVPTYFPIASADYKLTSGQKLNSLGSDSGSEAARYEVEFYGYDNYTYGLNLENIITLKNTPRPGRSGGGLITNDGLYVGTCVATTDTSGQSGSGIFTSIKGIETTYIKNGYEWLLKVSRLTADKIPIINMNEGSDLPNEINFPQNPISLPN